MVTVTKSPIDEDVTIIHSTFEDNNFLDPQYVKILKDLINSDETAYRVYTLGEWGLFQRRIFTKYKIIPQLPELDGGHWAYGIDFGLVNPTAVVKVYALGDKFYIEEKLYKTNLTNADIIEFFSHQPRGDIYGDPTSKMLIEEIRRAGYSAFEGHKGVKETIDLMQRFELVLPQTSQNLIKEIHSYQWKQTKDGTTLPEPVKFNDHACVAGECLVSTTKGDFPIKDLVGTTGTLYSYDEAQRKIVADRYLKVIKTGEKKTLKINLSKNESLILTEDHPVLLRDGAWKEAKELVVGDSLMPFYRQVDSHGHLRVNLNNGKYDFAHRVVWESFNDLIQDTWKYNLHHVDGDKLNNDLNNLDLLTRAEHCKLHKPHVRVTKEGLQKQHGKEPRVAKFKKVCPVCGKDFLAKNTLGVYCHQNCKAKALRRRRKEQFNHLIFSIEDNGVVPVYNILTEKTHNFACSGVIIHNCDAARYACWGLVERFGQATNRQFNIKPISTLRFPGIRNFGRRVRV